MFKVIMQLLFLSVMAKKTKMYPREEFVTRELSKEVTALKI